MTDRDRLINTYCGRSWADLRAEEGTLLAKGSGRENGLNAAQLSQLYFLWSAMATKRSREAVL